MTELDDHELLAEYARTQSEAAFAGLVARYVHLVYSAAARYTGNPHHAEEITQAVFLILAGKAGSLGRNVVLSGWLYQTARLTAANFVKGEIRRQHREQEAYMQSTLKEPESPAWRQIAPLLEEAMGSLGEADRNAVVLRYFENKTAREVAVGALGTVYAVSGGDNNTAALGHTLASHWSLASALAFLAWYVFAPQCASTLAVIRRETNSWKWAAVTFVYMLALAYVAALLVYQIAIRV